MTPTNTNNFSWTLHFLHRSCWRHDYFQYIQFLWLHRLHFYIGCFSQLQAIAASLYVTKISVCEVHRERPELHRSLFSWVNMCEKSRKSLQIWHQKRSLTNNEPTLWLWKVENECVLELCWHKNILHKLPSKARYHWHPAKHRTGPAQTPGIGNYAWHQQEPGSSVAQKHHV